MMITKALKHHEGSFPPLFENSVIESASTVTNARSVVLNIFDLFKRFTENPIVEIGGREIWAQKEGKLVAQGNEVNLVEITHCYTTAKALLAAMIGPEDAHAVMVSKSNFTLERKPAADLTYLQRLIKFINGNGESLTNQNSSDFYVYAFAFFKGPRKVANMPSEDQPVSNHVFLVVQYPNEKGDLQYRILQSFLECFDLKTDIDKPSNLMNQPNFESFLNGFEKLYMSETWTPELKLFYSTYFHVECSVKIDDLNPYSGGRPFVQGARSSYEKVQGFGREFEELKKTDLFKKIMNGVIL